MILQGAPRDALPPNAAGAAVAAADAAGQHLVPEDGHEESQEVPQEPRFAPGSQGIDH